jgi:hypothetical protein
MTAVKWAVRMTVLVALLAWPGAAFAAPDNDNPVDPTVNPAFNLGPTSFGPGDTTSATTLDGEALTASDATGGRCLANGTQAQDPSTEPGTRVVKTLWWTFKGTGGPVVVSSYFSEFDTVLSAWTRESDGFLHFQRCNDDIDPNDFTSEFVLDTTVLNKTYYVQLGGCDGCGTPDHGSAVIYAQPPPANDKRAGARSIPLNTNADGATYAARTDTGEKAACTQPGGSSPYGKTVWYRFSIPKAGTVTVDASGFDTAIALFQPGATQAIDCRFNASGGATSLPRHLGAGTYEVQVGGVGPGLAASRGTLNLKVNFVADTGPVVTPPPVVVTPPPVILPPTPQPLARVRTTFEHLGVWGATGRFTALTLRNVPAGATVRVTCKGQGCRKKRIVKRVRKATARLKLAKAMRRNNHLRPRALIEVRVTAPKRIGKVFQFRIRAFKPPSTKTLCLAPGTKRPRRCS